MRRRLLLAIPLLLSWGCAPGGPEFVRRPAEPPGAVLIRGASVLDVATGDVSPPRDVLVRGERIEAITAPGTLASPAGAMEIAAEGATLLPGLVDMHGHVGNRSTPTWTGGLPDPDANLRGYLYCGVTTVLDPADLSTQAFRRRDRVASGKLLGPTIFAAGPMITAPGGHPVAILRSLAPWWLQWYLIPRFSMQVDSPEAAREAVEEIAESKPDVVKLAVDRLPHEAPRIRRDVLEAAVAAARA
ncbi:MAG: amidohydrolase family protein, partial [Candidatus Binatia bacterium]